MKQKLLSIDKAIDEVESALFDRDEPGCHDTEWGDVIINTVGRLRLTHILKRLRVGYIRHTCIESLDPQDVAAREKMKRKKK